MSSKKETPEFFELICEQPVMNRITIHGEVYELDRDLEIKRGVEHVILVIGDKFKIFECKYEHNGVRCMPGVP